LLVADGKNADTVETDIRPDVAVGAQGGYTIRDAPQPGINSSTASRCPSRREPPSGFRTATSSPEEILRRGAQARASCRAIWAIFVANLSEFMSPEALNSIRTRRTSPSAAKASGFAASGFPEKRPALGHRNHKFTAPRLNPSEINMTGLFLKLNFDVSVLKYKGGYDVLGTIQFRYNNSLEGSGVTS